MEGDIKYNSVLMEQGEFQGDKKEGLSFLGPWEERLKGYLAPKFPQFLNGYNLTLFSILWSIVVLVGSHFANYDIRWLWVVSGAIFLHWLTDSFDGIVGQIRNSGLIKWGYYMDHFLDYIFLCCILIGYSFIVDDHFKYLLFFALAIVVGFMVNSYLSFAITNRFRVSYYGIGPTEMRLIYIVINTLLIIFGKTYMGAALPIVLAISLFGLCVVIFDTQKEIYELDIRKKQRKD